MSAKLTSTDNQIPDELKALPRWTTWKLIQGKKLPFSKNGTTAIKDPGLRLSFLEACAQMNGGGIGFVFDESDDLGGVDLDACRNPETGELTLWAQKIVKDFNSYTEISPSGTGVKIFAKGAPAKISPNVCAMDGEFLKGKSPQIEAYTKGRYFAVTGNPSPGSPSEIRSTPEAWGNLAKLLKQNRPKEKTTGRDDFIFKKACSLQGKGLPDEEILKTCLEVDAKADAANHPNYKTQGPLGETIVREKVNQALKFQKGKSGEKTVDMRGGAVKEIVDKAESALIENGVSIYQRGGELVRPVRLDRKQDGQGIKRAVGSTVLLSVDSSWLLEQMGIVLKWVKTRYGADGTPTEKICDPAPKYASTLLARVGAWRFPVLRGVLNSPTLASDGRIIEQPGFDEDSGLLLDFKSGTFPPIPTNPTQDEAKTALEKLIHPLRGFPFTSEAAKSVALSAMLTALIRSSLRTSPLHGFDAPTAGTGKSLLAEIPGLLATGIKPPSMSQGKTEEEDEKRLSTILHAGDPVILIDNCEKPLSGDFLCSMLTQETVQARILGLSERRILPCTALVLATGNNLTFAGDSSRRVVICRLDSKEEMPDQRVFDFDCHKEILQSRPELVIAGLTILHAFNVAGRPGKLKPFGSFEDYSWIRGALAWLGCADPADTREAILENDPRKNELLEVMGAWELAFGNKPIVIGDLTNPSDDEMTDLKKNLRSLLTDVCCRGQGWNSRSVGWWLRRNMEKVIERRCFKQDGKHHPEWFLDGAKSLKEQEKETADLVAKKYFGTT